MNLTQPPFDDVHVRRAMNWIIDRSALTKAWGGAVSGVPARHIFPNTMLRGQLDSYQPFKTPGDAGSLAKAKAEMENRSTRTRVASAATRSARVSCSSRRPCGGQGDAPAIQANAAKIGITFAVRTVNGAYPVIQTTSKNIPISTRPRWFKDFADAVDVHRPAVQGLEHHPERQHELLPRRPEAVPGEVAWDQGQYGEHPRASTSCQTVRAIAARQRAYQLLRRHRQGADAAGRPVGAVHVGEDGHDPRPEGHEVELRPERGLPALAHVAVSK